MDNNGSKLTLSGLYKFILKNYSELGIESKNNIHYRKTHIHITDGKNTNQYSCHITIMTENSKPIINLQFNNMIKKIPVNNIWPSRFLYAFNSLRQRHSFKVTPQGDAPGGGSMGSFI